MADKAVRAVHMGDALMVAGIVVALASTLGWAGTLWLADTWDSPLLWLDAAALLLAVALFAAGFVVRRRALRRGRLTPASFLGPEEERAVVEAIKQFELRTSGEIRVHLHGGRVPDVLAAARAAFGRLGMAATRERNGVLFFVATAQRRFAVLGDAGIDAKVPDGFWTEIARGVEAAFARGDFAGGLAGGVRAAGEAMASFFPRREDDVNELPDEISRG